MCVSVCVYNIYIYMKLMTFNIFNEKGETVKLT